MLEFVSFSVTQYCSNFYNTILKNPSLALFTLLLKMINAFDAVVPCIVEKKYLHNREYLVMLGGDIIIRHKLERNTDYKSLNFIDQFVKLIL